MSQNPNQFSQTVEKGQQDLKLNPNTIPCQVDTSEAGTLVPGQLVKLVDTIGGVPKIAAITAITDKIFGAIPYIFKKNEYVAFDYLEIASESNVLYLEAGAAIARGAKVMAQLVGNKVVTATAGNTVVGFAFDKALADGDLIRVYMQPFSEEVISGTAADVLDIKPTADLTALVPVATNITAANIGAAAPADPTEAEIETEMDALNLEIETALDLKADNADVETLRTETEARLDDIETKLDAYRAAMQAAGLMA